MGIITVSQLNRYLASRLKGDTHLRNFLIRGEISNFSRPKSGHLYFKLKDEKSVICAVMYRNMASLLRFQPENGMKVILSAGIGVYEANGEYQLNVTDIQPEGIGAQALALEQRKKKLEAAGLFDASARRPLPKLPRTVGVITSGTGDAVQDIIRNIGRRCPIVRILVFPVLVQGADAPEAIARAVRFAGTQNCDVLIVGRGGGSSENLDAFNSECVAYAVHESPVPVISAVGHERDFTITDAVADFRVSTPTGAAEAAVPELALLHERIAAAEHSIRFAYETRLRKELHRLEQVKGRLMCQRPDIRIRVQQERLRRMTDRLEQTMQRQLSARASKLHTLQEKLHTLDPLLVLRRGYAAVYHENGEVLPAAAEAHPGEQIRVQLRDGSLLAKVEEIHGI